MNQQQRQLISRFIKKYSTENGTESMLDYVADANGMLGACKELFDINGAIDNTLVDWFYQECSRYSVAPDSFADAVTQMLAIFNGNYESQDHYATLGLTSDANANEVKSAYRKLSLQHHPDRAANNATCDPQIFININKAYRAITEPEKCNLQNSSPESKPEWNATQKRTVTAIQKKKLIYWGSGMVVILLVMMVVGSVNVRKRAMLAGLTENRAAFVPPQNEVVQETPDKIVGRDDVALAKEENIPPKPIEPMVNVFKEVMETTVQVDKDVIVTSVRELSRGDEKSPPKRNEILPKLKKEQIVVVESVRQTPLQADGTTQADSIELQSDRLPIEISDEEQPETEPVVQNEIINIQAQTVTKTEAPETEKLLTDKVYDEKNINHQSVKTEFSPKDNVVEPEDQQKQIDQFFTEYQKAYAERNIISFSRYFSPEAIENDKPFSVMIPAYIDLFESTSDILLKINVLFWQNRDEKVQVEGRFSVKLKYKRGRESTGAGTISFLLRKEDGSYKIASLAYEFD